MKILLHFTDFEDPSSLVQNTLKCRSFCSFIVQSMAQPEGGVLLEKPGKGKILKHQGYIVVLMNEHGCVCGCLC